MPRIVAVVSCLDDLDRAIRLRRPPDLFELRLDALVDVLPTLDASIERLRAPFIITARHPLEGGLNELSLERRRNLLLRYLPIATCLDVELRSAGQLRSVLDAARASGLKCILSLHEFQRPPAYESLRRFTQAESASSTDILKIVSRTETAAELTELITFFDSAKHKCLISAMGVGAFGRTSRRMLARRGSCLNYAHLGTSIAPGQLSLAQLRRVLQPR